MHYNLFRMAKRKKRHRRRRVRYDRILLLLGIFAVLVTGLVYLLKPREEVSATPTSTPDPYRYHDYDWEYLDTGSYYQYEDNTYTSKIGIDVSYSQAEIDWSKVKEAGIDFAVIRAGYRGYSEGILHTDDRFYSNMDGAGANGIETAVYYFSQAVTEEEAIEEAQYVLNLIRDYNVSFVAYDLEEADAQGRIRNLSSVQATANALAFCNIIEKAGYQPMIYGSHSWLIQNYDFLSIQDQVPLWMASYTKQEKSPDFPYVFNIWQYTNTGTVDGIDTAVDLNLWLVKK